jgi:glutathione peroxidase
MTDSIYDTEVTTLTGEQKDLSEYRGKVLLVVNTASKCGFTPQYTGLEKLYEDFREQGLEVLGFPCNQFGKQEPGDEAEIGEFCETRFGVQFPMHAKVDVNGSDTHPLYAQLKHEAPGLLGSEAVKWNFTKFLVDRSGAVVSRFAPKDKPEKLRGSIEKLLGKDAPG